MNNRIRKAFAFLASVAMLLASSIGSGLITPVYAANTKVSTSTLVSKYPKHKITAAQLKKLQNQNWNVKTFTGRYKLVSERSQRVNNGSTFKVDFTSGKLSSIKGAIAYCMLHGAANPRPGPGSYKATVTKVGKEIRITVNMTAPDGQKQGTTASGSGYQNLGLWLQFEPKEDEFGTIRVSKTDSKTGSLITGSAAKFEIRDSSGKVVATLTTGKIGTATSGKLAAGKYKVQEVGAPSGYTIDTTAAKTATVTDDKVTDVTFKDTKKLASIGIQKKFRSPKTGDARVIGAQYTLYAASDIKNPETGNVIWKAGEAISKEEGVGDDGTKTISTPDGLLTWNDLPDGSYKIKETKAPTGAKLSPEEVSFTVRDGKSNIDKNLTMNEDVIPYKAKLIKKDENGKPLAGAKFEVKLESDVKAQGWDKASVYGTFTSGENGESEVIELPYGRYVVKETSAPEGYKVSKEEKALVIDGEKEIAEIEFSNEREEIDLHTTATDGETGTHTGTASEKAVINDVVKYTNLIRGKEYTVKGKLMDKETNTPLLINDKEVTAEKTFTAEERNGEITLTYEFDATSLRGKSTVVFEDMYEEGKLVSTHADINDEGQTVHYPNVGTQAADVETKTNIAKPSEKTTIRDTVKYTNLVVGEEYTAKGKLMDKETGEELKDKNGNAVTGETTFKAEKSDGEVIVEFTFDSSLLEGKTTVVFEDLYSNEKLVASHADINDENQSVHFPKVQTTATDTTTKTHSAITGKTTIQDVVKYTNLVPGKEYTINGKLVNKKTKEVMKNAEGGEVTATKTFTAKEADGEVTIEFSIDTSELAGNSVVAFEDLYLEDVLVATHSDINDEGQTVDIIKVRTTAKDGKTNGKVGLAEKKTALVDTVKAENLHVGEEYTIKGKLMNPDGSEVKDGKGNPVTAEKTFKATEKNMNVDITFTFDATLLKTTQTVVFEDLYSGDKVVAAHADLKDTDQTVEYPKVKTTATVNGEHTADTAKKTVLKDIVSYQGLHVGEEYVIKGKLMNADTGKQIKVNGNAVTAEARFTPQTSDGTTEVEFVFDSTPLHGVKTVVFEDLYQGDVHVATHSDLKDRNQSVEFNPKEKTPFTPTEKSETPDTPAKASPVKTWDDTPIAGKIAVIAAALAAAGAAVYVSRRKKKADN